MSILIKNGIIVDGSRKKPYAGSLLLDDGKIKKILAPGQEPAADKIIDTRGHIISPGFINIHSHSDKTYLGNPTFESMLTGGVTFELVGQCGKSYIPISDKNLERLANCGDIMPAGCITPESYRPRGIESYAADYAEKGATINVGCMLGHGALRSYYWGMDMNELSASDLDKMCGKLDEELKAGCFGLSLGLIYAPGSCCSTDEIIEMAKVVKANNKFIAVHMRNENQRIFEALDEMLHVAEATGVRLEISHLKLMGREMWGRSGELLARIDEARARGITIFADQYPYTASRSSLQVCFPSKAMDGGFDVMAERLADDGFWNEMSSGGTLPEMKKRGGAENIMIQSFPDGIDFPEFAGRFIPDIAKELGYSNEEAVRHIIRTVGGSVMCVYFSQDEKDMLNILKQRDISVISDGTAYEFNNHRSTPHPRNTGSFPRALRLIRENNLMSIEDAVYKMTGLPSTIMGTDKRFGFIREGLDATITIFDADTVTDKATYENPDQASEGIDYVLVNGEVVLDENGITTARPGKCILDK